MKNNNSILLFIRRNIFCILCFLLFSLVLVTCSLSFGKYNVSNKNDGNSNIGSFSVSTSIDSVTGTSFSNTPYWGTSDNDPDSKIALNSTKTLKFSINNFNGEGTEKKVSDVKLKYNLSFSTPKAFGEKLAIQVFDKDDKPLLPQIVICDLINSVSDNKKSGTYETNKSKDYGSTTEGIDDLAFNVETDNNKNFTATSGTTIIKIEEEEKETSQTLFFRLWDTSKLTNSENNEIDSESGDVLSPLEVTYTEKITMYNISISIDSFVLPAGKEKTENLSIKLVPIDVISDNDLGGTIVDIKTKNENGEEIIIGSPKVKEIYASEEKEWYIQSTIDNCTECVYDNPAFVGDPTKTTSSVVEGSATIYKDGAESERTYEKSDEILESPQNFTTTTIDAEEIVWDPYKLINESQEPTIDTYCTGGYIAKTVRSSKYGTIFFIHKLDVSRTGNQKITVKVVETKITSSNSIKKQTQVNEKTSVQRLDGEKDIILLNITKTTRTTYSGDLTITTTTTTTHYERKYEQNGFIYRGYYKDGKNNLRYWADAANTSEELEKNRAEPLFEINYEGTEISIESAEQEKYYTDNEYYVERINVQNSTVNDSTDSQDTINETKSLEDPITLENTEYIQKKIERAYKYHKITIDECKRNVVEENTESEIKSYDAKHTFVFYEENIQKYFLSQCYSKEYPFYVNVIFEQTQ